MSDEASSLETRHDFDQVHLTLRHHPLFGWAFVSILVVIPAVILSGVLGPEGWAGQLLLLVPTAVMFSLLLLSLVVQTTVHLAVSPTHLQLKGWTGVLARPQTHRYPLHQVQLRWNSAGEVNETPVYTLALDTPHGPVYIIMIRCSQEEREAIVHTIALMAQRAEERHGRGEREIPRELQQRSRSVGHKEA